MSEPTCVCGRALTFTALGTGYCSPCGGLPGRCLCDVLPDDGGLSLLRSDPTLVGQAFGGKAEQTIGDVARLERAVQTIVEAHSQGLLTDGDRARLGKILSSDLGLT